MIINNWDCLNTFLNVNNMGLSIPISNYGFERMKDYEKMFLTYAGI